MILAKFLYRIQGLFTRRTNETEAHETSPACSPSYLVRLQSFHVSGQVTYSFLEIVFPLSLGFDSDNRTSCTLVAYITH